MNAERVSGRRNKLELFPNNDFVGHAAYLSMLMVEVYHTHPVLRTFVELLNQTRRNRLDSDSAGLNCILLLNNIFIGVGDGGRGGGTCPPPKKKNKIREKYFSGNYHVKFGHFPAHIT